MDLSQTRFEEDVIDIVENRLNELTDRLVAEVDRRGLFNGAPDERFVRSLRSASIAELHAGFTGFRHDRTLPASPPAETAELARRTATLSIPLTTLLGVYMIALEVYWTVIHEAVVSVPASPDLHNSVLSVGTRYLHSYMAQISTLAAQEYTDERERTARRQALRRVALVRDVLAGSGPTRTVLAYDLHQAHIGLIATGAAADDALASLHSRSVRSLLVRDGDTTWAWIAGSDPEISAALRAIDPAPGTSVRIGIGHPQHGPAGFRTTHRQATSAHLISLRIGHSVVRHEEHALCSLALADQESARVFIQDELGRLLLDEQRSARLLETLHAYLDCGQNGTSTAARLGVSARSVSHRLRLVEASLGYPVATRAPELHVALRFLHLRHMATAVRRHPESESAN